MVDAFHVVSTQQTATGELPIPIGTVAGLEAPPATYSPGAMEELVRLFPGGITRHGARYVADLSQQPANWASWATELFFEAVRRADFPDLLSRMQSVFAFETRQDALAFIGTHRFGGPSAIYRVRGELGHRANMSLVNPKPGIAAFTAARQYWLGQQGPAPILWELLLRPPVEFAELVETVVT